MTVSVATLVSGVLSLALISIELVPAWRTTLGTVHVTAALPGVVMLTMNDVFVVRFLHVIVWIVPLVSLASPEIVIVPFFVTFGFTAGSVTVMNGAFVS